ncbi:polcalcin Cup a 4-like [Argentina anserina]|uniref:polcalcin Cup a 4-like n=1 Tax=Argentina anserina TaxID=57926 RepID=UPI0021765102|nr:polcalcin Cup a 4-like [Potentilla anserina]
MAIKSKCVASDGKRVMTTEELKKWLKKFDTDKDGRISKEELRQAIRSTGGRFAAFKSSRGLRSADVNKDGYIGEEELDSLVEFAQKHLNVRIVNF